MSSSDYLSPSFAIWLYTLAYKNIEQFESSMPQTTDPTLEAREIAWLGSDEVLAVLLPNADSSQKTALQAVIKEDFHATKLEIRTGRPRQHCPLATEFATSWQKRRVVVKINFEILRILRQTAESDALRLVATRECLMIEHNMYKAMIKAGVSMDGWLLQPIGTQLDWRMTMYQRSHSRVHTIVRRLKVARDGIQAQWKVLEEQEKDEMANTKKSTEGKESIRRQV
jgi:hypothetical protein